MAEAMFSPGKKGRRAGVALYWHKRRLIDLGRLYSVEKDKNPRLKDAEIARRITKHPDFKKDDPDQLRQRLPGAYELYQESWQEFLWSIGPEDVPEYRELGEFEDPPEYDF